MSVVHRMESAAGREGAPGRRSPLVLLAIGLAVVAALVNVWVPVLIRWYPWVTPDGQDYLRHASDLIGVGFIQQGYRQIGYPAMLALIDALAGPFGADSLVVTAYAQQALLLASAAATAWILRWWSVPVLVVALSPPMGVYPNLVLTESIGISLAMLGAAAAIAASDPDRTGRWFVAAASIAAVLPVVRLHWIVVSIGICIALLWSRWSDRIGRRRVLATCLAVAAASGLFTMALAWENKVDEGVFHPSLGAERQLFWMTWAAIVPDHEDAVQRSLPEIYGDGSPYPFVLAVDGSDLDYEARSETYREAVDAIFRVTDTTLTEQRLQSVIGVALGGRVDDLGLGDNPEIPVVMPSPPLHAIVRALVLSVLVAATVGLFLPPARPFGGAALAVLFGYASLSFTYPLDNLRFLLPAYLAIAVLAFGGLSRWGTMRGRQTSAAEARTRST